MNARHGVLLGLLLFLKILNHIGALAGLGLYVGQEMVKTEWDVGL